MKIAVNFTLNPHHEISHPDGRIIMVVNILNHLLKYSTFSSEKIHSKLTYTLKLSTLLEYESHLPGLLKMHSRTEATVALLNIFTYSGTEVLWCNLYAGASDHHSSGGSASSIGTLAAAS